MVILYTNLDFHIPEHIALLIYAMIFTVFFTVHTYDHWDDLNVSHIMKFGIQDKGVKM